MNIQKLTENYINGHPSIKDNLARGLINYSKLTRMIAKETKLDARKNFDAILIACRRYYQKIKSLKSTDEQIIEILKRSKVEIKNKIIVAVLEKEVFVDNLLHVEKEIKKREETFDMVEGANSITLITSHEFIDTIKKSFKNKIIKITEHLIEITIKSPKEIETTPGTYAYLCSLFGENGINIVETLSCWTDTIFLIKENDAGKVIGLLRF